MDSGKVRSRSATPSNGNVASFAHEISNPLAALLNLLHLVESEATLTQRGRRYLNLAEEEIQRISQLTHSALEHSKDTTVSKDIDIPELVRSVLDVYASRFESKGIEVNSRYCDDGNLAGDAGLLRRMLSESAAECC